MPLWGKTGASLTKPKYLSATQKAATSLTERGWVLTQPGGIKELLVPLTIPAGAPINSVAPAITGNTVNGDALTVTTGTWSNSPTFAYQWKRGTVSVGTNSNTYTTGAPDVGAIITCDVTATSNSISIVSTSNAVGPIT